MGDGTSTTTGGCQCGAVRYQLRGPVTSVDICHCRMCQRALGNLFMAVASVVAGQLVWTAGRPATYQSSTVAERGFCAACGTPLFFRYLARDEIALTLGSLDDPAGAVPTVQYGIESRVPWFDQLATLPALRTEDDPPPGGLAAVISHQHPDGAGS